MLAIIRALQEWRLYRGRGTSVRDLDRPQEPGVLHDSQATEPEASLMVALPLPLRLHTPHQENGSHLKHT